MQCSEAYHPSANHRYTGRAANKIILCHKHGVLSDELLKLLHEAVAERETDGDVLHCTHHACKARLKLREVLRLKHNV